MRNPLSSPRFRRRMAWGAPSLVLAGVAVGLIVEFPNTGKKPKEVFSNAPVRVYRSPRTVPAGPARRAAVLLVTSDFVRTAVLRTHLDRSWALVDPSLKQGYTLRQWEKGDIPVVPYPAAGIEAWKIDWSYANDVGIDVVLAPKPHSGLTPKSFMIELKRSPRSHGRWLVASWVPHGVSEAADLAAASKNQKKPPPATGLSQRWLLLPLGLLAALVIVPLGVLALRGWLRHTRADRAYRASLRS